MFPIVEKLAKINQFVECSIPEPNEMYRKYGYINATPSSNDSNEVISYNRSSKIDVLSDAVLNASSSDNVVE